MIIGSSPASRVGGAGVRHWRGATVLHRLGDRLDMRRRRAAAAADDVDQPFSAQSLTSVAVVSGGSS